MVESALSVLVTGASGGIGLELARLFARDGHPVTIVARRRDRLSGIAVELRELGAPRATPIAFDLARRDSARELAGDLAARGLEPAIVVNNAGYGRLGPFDESATEEQVDMIDLNVVALVELTRRLLPGVLAAGGRGGILNVASTAAFQPGPYMAVYYATKAFVLSFSEALAVELAGRARVSCLCPGPVPTGFQERAGFREGVALNAGLFPMMRATAVARAGYAGFRRGKRVVIPGLVNRAGVLGVRAIPRSTAARIVAGLQKQRDG